MKSARARPRPSRDGHGPAGPRKPCFLVSGAMALRIVGAGLGRTGTRFAEAGARRPARREVSLLPTLMIEVFDQPDDVAEWKKAAQGEDGGLGGSLDGYVAAVDWPCASFYDVLHGTLPRCPRAPVHPHRRRGLVEERQRHHLRRHRRVEGMPPPLEEMIFSVFDARFTPDWRHHDAAVAASTATTSRCARRYPPTGWSNEARVTAGARCAGPSACPSPPTRSRTSTRHGTFRHDRSGPDQLGGSYSDVLCCSHATTSAEVASW